MDWKSLFPTRVLTEPTYKRDIVGAQTRCDERENVFARRDLRPGDAAYDAYYAQHPEQKAGDDALRAMPRPGFGGSPGVTAMVEALFGSVTLLASDEATSGAFAVREIRPRVDLTLEQAAERVKAFARFLGADVVGIGPLDQAYVYSHVGRTYYGRDWGEAVTVPHPWAISIGVRMNTGGLVPTAPQAPAMLESGLAYARGALIAVQLAAMIRALGYEARAHHLRSYQILSVPVAVDAGLGQMGRCGFLINRDFGNCLRISTVTTDLPLACDPPVDFGIEQFCDRCLACAKACPVGAIPTGDKSVVRGVRKWQIDAEKCYAYWHEVGSDCALCIVACPWSRSTLGQLSPEEAGPAVPGSFVRPRRLPDWLVEER